MFADALLAEPITVATHRFDETRVVPHLFDLVAQALDVRVDRLRLGEVFPTPCLAKQVLARDDFASILHKAGKQLELARSKVERPVVTLGGVCVLVQRDAADRDGFRSSGEVATAATAQQRVDARDELSYAEGLGKVVVAADFETDNLVELGIACRQEQHRRRGDRAQAPAQLVAVHAGKHDVEYEQVVVLLARCVQRVFAVVEHVDFVPFFSEGVSNEFSDRALVVDDENALGVSAMVFSFWWRITRLVSCLI